jgi:glutamate-1-semialdehyde 2,1-aminomutase
MAAIIGKKEVMQMAQESFISSTSWTERIGPTAALATIRKFIKNNVPQHLSKIGKMISGGWRDIARKHGLEIEVSGTPPIPAFKFTHKDSRALHTLFTQEMLKRGYLASKSVYVSYAHKEKDIKEYLGSIEEVFTLIKKAIDNKKIYKLLKGPIAHQGFKRLT